MTREHEQAARELRNMASYIRNRGLTGWVKNRSVAGHYREVFRLLVVIEDREGVDATVKLSARFATLTDEARRRGLLSPGEILAAEREAVAAADRARR